MNTDIHHETEDITERLVAIAEFIRALRHANNHRPIGGDELDAAAMAWSDGLPGVHSGYLSARDADSLFASCAQQGYCRVEQVLACFNAGPGAQQRQAEESAEEAAREEQHSAGITSKGPGFQMLLDYLAQRGRAVTA
jgi:hypothetical protein